MVDVGLILHHDRQITANVFQEIIFDDGYDDTGRADIFLNAGIDEIELLDIDRPAEEITGHIAKQRHVEGRKGFPFRPVNRVVRRHIDVVRTFFYGKGIGFWNIRKTVGLTRATS